MKYPSDTSNTQDLELDDGTEALGLGNVANTIEDDSQD
jgi:hypothetical protein